MPIEGAFVTIKQHTQKYVLLRTFFAVNQYSMIIAQILYRKCEKSGEMCHFCHPMLSLFCVAVSLLNKKE